TGGGGDDEDGRRLNREYFLDHGVRGQRRRTSRIFGVESRRADLHQGGGVPVWAAWRAGELGASGILAADAERDEPGHARIEDRGNTIAPTGRADRCRQWRAVPGV